VNTYINIQHEYYSNNIIISSISITISISITHIHIGYLIIINIMTTIKFN